MFSSFVAGVMLLVAPVLCIIFTNQDRQDFEAQFPNGLVSEGCAIRPTRQMWDRVTHEMLDKYPIGAQALLDPACLAAHDFMNALPQQDVNPALDFPPPPDEG
jgi:hypothetical protein